MTAEKSPTEREKTIANTVITIVVVGFCGVGMLQGKVPTTWFLAVSVLAVGWIPPAVILQLFLLYQRAMHSPPPGVASLMLQVPTAAPPSERETAPHPATPVAAEAASGDPGMPPPGIVGLFFFAGLALELLRQRQNIAPSIAAAVGLSVVAFALWS